MQTIKVLAWIGAVWGGLGIVVLLPELGVSEDAFWGIVVAALWGSESVFILHYLNGKKK